MILKKGNVWGRIRGKVSLNPEQALRMFGFPMRPDADGVIFRQYAYYDDNNRKHTGTFISNYIKPSNPQTGKQTTQRTKMINANADWQSLREWEKRAWNRRAKGKHMSGFNLHNRYKLLGII